MLSRRIPAAAAAAMAIATLLGQTPVYAAAPMVKTPAPGYYRMMLGEFEITALNDGTVDLPVDKLLHQKAAKTAQALSKAFLSLPLELSVNAFLVNTGDKLVLIDTGAAGLFGPTLGKLIVNLKAAGYQPEQVDEIYITHMHPDHVGGLAAAGKAAFPNAVVRAEKHDADYWLSKANLEKAPEGQKGMFQGAIASLAPYADAGRLNTFEGNTALVPGIKAVSSYGHTPGHTTYVVESKGQKLVLLGDLVHVAAVQFDDPSVTIDFDSDGKAALAQRKAAFAVPRPGPPAQQRQGLPVRAGQLHHSALRPLRVGGARCAPPTRNRRIRPALDSRYSLPPKNGRRFPDAARSAARRLAGGAAGRGWR